MISDLFIKMNESEAGPAAFRKRAVAERIRRMADRLPAVLAVQIRRDAAVLDIEADWLESGRALVNR